MVWTGKDLKIIQFQPSAMGRDVSHQTMPPKALSSLALNTARNGAFTTSLGNLCQGLTILTVKNFFLISILHKTGLLNHGNRGSKTRNTDAVLCMQEGVGKMLELGKHCRIPLPKGQQGLV